MLLGMVWRVLAASFIAFMVSGYINDFIFDRYHPKNRIVRVIVSTGSGILIDTGLFVIIAFTGIYSMASLLMMWLSISLIKALIEIGLYPLTFWLAETIKAVEGRQVFEKPIRAAAAEKKEKHD